MTVDTAKIHKLDTRFVYAAVVIFICLLLILPYQLTQLTKHNSAQVNTQLFTNPSLNEKVEDIHTLADSQWQTSDNLRPDFSNKVYWLKLNISPKTAKQTRFLLIQNSLVEQIDVWLLNNEKNNEQTTTASLANDNLAYEHRTIQHQPDQLSIPITRITDISKNDNALTLIIRVQHSEPAAKPVEVWQEAQFISYLSLQKLTLGVFYGFMAAMAVGCLFIFAASQNKLFAIYAGYVTSIATAVCAQHGFGLEQLWSDNGWIVDIIRSLFLLISMRFFVAFTIRLLDLKSNSLRAYPLLSKVQFVFYLAMALCLILPNTLLNALIIMVLIITIPLVITPSIKLAFKGHLSAQYFCSAWIIMLIVALSIYAQSIGLFQSPVEPSYLIIVAVVIQIVFLSLSLAMYFSKQMLTLQSALNLAIYNEQEALKARDEITAIQEQTHADLEYSIEERTLELEIALRELSEKNSELEKLSANDPLTGLMNRRYFDKRLLAETRRSKRELTSLGLAILDIDHFKKINDTYGHLCGDYCLKVFAQILKEYIKRPSDIICRYGGEEFVLILPNTDNDGMHRLLETIREAVQNKKITFEGLELSMTVSIGACSRVVTREDEHTALLGYVDKLLYEAKEAGRNCVKLSE